MRRSSDTHPLARARRRTPLLSSLLALLSLGAGTACDDDPTGPVIMPITWTAEASEFAGKNNEQLRFRCPADGTADAVWGTDIYTDDSSICTAAVHVGRITLAAGGEVTIEIRPGQASYPPSARNGISSYPYGEWDRSFIVR